MVARCDRREVLRQTAGACWAAVLGDAAVGPTAIAQPLEPNKGGVVGQPLAARAGMEVLAAGGNAVDAAVAAALVAGVVAVHSCGIGGYGGHMVLARAGSRKVTAIDFNSTAPQTAREDMFPLDDKGAVKGGVNTHGWLAAGVPATLAGLQLALDRYGTQSFRQLVQPAIRHAREGFPVTPSLAAALRSARNQLRKDPASARLFLKQGEPLPAGSTFRNPDLAALLQTLAERNSVDTFYRGDLGRRIADAFQRHHGLVTAADLAAYHAREVTPLELTWRGYTVCTAPLTAGGATVLQTLTTLKALGWEQWPADDPKTRRACLEALRLAWDDRLTLLGDPDRVAVPVARLLSESHAKNQAAQVETALRQGKPVHAASDGRGACGTIHLNAADAQGNMVALTLTHGGAFGAQVTVEGLGLILGHGMSRFDPQPGKPNSPGPGKRPLHNMCPTVVLRDGKPVLAVGATGGRKIPNSVFTVLLHYVGRNASITEAVAAPRLHTEGNLDLMLEPSWPEADAASWRQLGYTIQRGLGATVHAICLAASSGPGRTASR
jgi:gamma-glutamyltranspeptidase/glutathione hydrolase